MFICAQSFFFLGSSLPHNGIMKKRSYTYIVFSTLTGYVQHIIILILFLMSQGFQHIHLVFFSSTSSVLAFSPQSFFQVVFLLSLTFWLFLAQSFLTYALSPLVSSNSIFATKVFVTLSFLKLNAPGFLRLFSHYDSRLSNFRSMFSTLGSFNFGYATYLPKDLPIHFVRCHLTINERQMSQVLLLLHLLTRFSFNENLISPRTTLLQT